MKNMEKSEGSTSNDDKIDKQQKENGVEGCDKVINKMPLETKDNKKEKKRMNIETVNIILTLCFSFFVAYGEFCTIYNLQQTS